MTPKKYAYDNKQEFLEKLTELIESGIPRRYIAMFTPYPVHEVDDILNHPQSKLRYFTLIGAISGLLTGLLFTTLTSLAWPLIGGGKPIVSIPAFIIIAFELTILFGALFSFTGFLILSKLPGIKQIVSPEEYGNQFIIQLESEG